MLGGWDDHGVLLRRTGTRSFAVEQAPGMPTHTVHLYCGDRDGDGDMDVVAFGRDGNLELSNDGTGAMTRHAAFGSSDGTDIVAEVDVDRDGDDDLLRIAPTPDFSIDPNARVAVSYEVRPGLLEHIGETFMPARIVGLGQQIGNVNGDAFPDLIMQVVPSPELIAPTTLQFGVHNGRRALFVEFAERSGGISNGFFADLDGDGLDEYVFTGATTGFLANVAGTLATTITPLPVSPWTHAGAVLDADGDGDADLLLASTASGVTTLILLTQDLGVWTDETSLRIATPSLPGQNPRLHVADLDGDGTDDVWARTWQDHIVYRNLGGSFVVEPDDMLALSTGSSSIGDLDGDGDIDLHISRKVYLNQGDATFVDGSATIPNISESAFLSEMQDVDDDGNPDLVGQGFVLWNDGDANFTPSTTTMPTPLFGGPAILAMVDVDLDGDPDLFETGEPFESLHINRHRQTTLVGAGALGASFTIRYETRPAGANPPPTAVWLLGSLQRIEPLLLGDCGWLQIDPTLFAVLGVAVLPAAGGTYEYVQDVPADPYLIGTPYFAQSIDLKGARLRLGNLVETYLGR